MVLSIWCYGIFIFTMSTLEEGVSQIEVEDFNSMFNVSNDDLEAFNLIFPDVPNDSEKNSRLINVSNDDLKELKREVTAESTKKKARWGMNLFRNW